MFLLSLHLKILVTDKKLMLTVDWLRKSLPNLIYAASFHWQEENNCVSHLLLLCSTIKIRGHIVRVLLNILEELLENLSAL